MIKFTETVLRDGNQSKIATRLRYSDFKDVLNQMDEIGYYSIECWGGAVYDSCLRFLNENPWDRLRKIKSHFKKTKLQMLLRGKNLLGYTPYPDVMVEDFVRLSIKNGISIIRVFDPLNDINNVKNTIKYILKYGGEPSGAICYTVSPVHNIENFVNYGIELKKAGVKSICIKDMSGSLMPDITYKLILSLKKIVNLPVVLHTHDSSGLANIAALKAMEAGVDIIDTCISSFSGGTSQPPTETISLIAEKLFSSKQLNYEKLNYVNSKFKEVLIEYFNQKIINLDLLIPNINSLIYQIPGGMYSNLLHQLKEQKIEHKLKEVLDEVVNVRKDLGYPPLVTPISQMVGTQAVVNVLNGERYKYLSKEIINYLCGVYGRAPSIINESLLSKITTIGDTTSLTESAYLQGKKELKNGDIDLENYMSLLLFPNIDKREKTNYDENNSLYLDNRIKKWIKPNDLPDFTFLKKEVKIFEVKAMMSGNIINVYVMKGDKIKKGDILLILESMKMENQICSPSNGIIKEVLIKKNQNVFYDDLLVLIEVNDD